MEHLDFPSREIWGYRREWMDRLIEESEIYESYSVSDHAVALMTDLQCCYCAGAWLAVIILSVSIIDAHVREDVGNNKIGTAQLLKENVSIEGIEWLRKLRNRYVHHDIENPVFRMNEQYERRDDMEKDATKAVEMVVYTLFQ